MNKTFLIILLVLGGFVGVSSLFIVTETEYAIKFQLGRIVKSDFEPGIHWKLPFVNNVRKFDRRLLTLDTNPEQMLTSEQKFVAVDSFVKWRIVDVARFYTSTQRGKFLTRINRRNGNTKDIGKWQKGNTQDRIIDTVRFSRFSLSSVRMTRLP